MAYVRVLAVATAPARSGLISTPAMAGGPPETWPRSPAEPVGISSCRPPATSQLITQLRLRVIVERSACPTFHAGVGCRPPARPASASGWPQPLASRAVVRREHDASRVGGHRRAGRGRDRAGAVCGTGPVEELTPAGALRKSGEQDIDQVPDLRRVFAVWPWGVGVVADTVDRRGPVERSAGEGYWWSMS